MKDVIQKVIGITDLAPAARLILIAIHQYCDGHNDVPITGMQLSMMTGMTQFTISKHVSDLEKAGALKVNRSGRRSPNRYTLTM